MSPLMGSADPHARPLIDFGIPALLLALLTGLLFFLPLDLLVEGWFYSEERGGWFLKDADPLVLIYKKGLIPALCVTFGAILVLLGGFKSHSLRRYRKVATYLLLVMVIAPGLLVNALMKEGWGRPRPRQIEEFGGDEVYERVWEYDGASYGKSFPSGHAAMGFFFFSLYFLLRREGRKAIYLWLGVALGLGFLLGFTRMAQGGHFPSDVVWSAGVCYFVAAGLYYAMGLQRNLGYVGGKMTRGAVLGCGLALLGVGLLGVGTPYHEAKSFEVETATLQGAGRLKLKLELPRANLRVVWVDGFSLSAEAEGFGSPGSRIEDRFESSRDGDICEVELRQKKGGFFATLEQPMSLELPRDLPLDGDIALEKGVLVIELDRAARGFLDMELGEVDLTLLVPAGLALKVEVADGVEVEAENRVKDLAWDGQKRRWKRGEEPVVKVRVKSFGGGRFLLQEAEDRGD